MDLPTTLATLADTLKALEAPPPSASPSDKAQWDALQTAAADLAPHLTRLFGPQLLASPSPPPSPSHGALQSTRNEENKETKHRQTKDALVAERAIRIIRSFGEDAVEPEDIPDIISLAPIGSRAKVEDGAFKLLCRGYAFHDSVDWISLLSLHTVGLPCPEELRKNATEIQNAPTEIDDIFFGTVNATALEVRLLRQHVLMSNVQETNASATWTLHVLNQIEALKFAADWNNLSGEGSLLTKARFYKLVYAIHDSSHIPVSSDVDRVEAYIDEYASDKYRKWRKINVEPIVTARNRLYTLYHTFGAAVLMDTVWSVSSLAAASRHFNAVLEELIDAIPETPSDDGPSVALTLAPLHASSTKTLLAILEVMGGKDTRDYVATFLEENPPMRCKY